MPVNPHDHITVLTLPQPLYIILLREGIVTVGDLATKTPAHVVERFSDPLVKMIQALNDGSYFPKGVYK